jgi:N-formylglutamate amidohydrolase
MNSTNRPTKNIFATIPHSGEKIPQETPWLLNLSEPHLMRDVDRFVDRLYQPALEAMGISFVKTEWHRYAVDLNRVPEDVDASSVQGSANPAGMHRRGFHWVVTTLGEPLMSRPMSLETHRSLVQKIYDPFHRSVKEQYQIFEAMGFKEVYHLDLHSMPSMGTKEHRDPGELRADVVVSDCKAQSSKKEFVDTVILAYVRAGFKVAYNWPYFGGRVSEVYGKPEKGHHAVQVEINRALYMNEDTKHYLPEKAEAVQKKLQLALAEILLQI